MKDLPSLPSVITSTKEIVTREYYEAHYFEARVFLQIYVAGESGHIVNIFSDNEEVLKKLADVLQDSLTTEGPNDYIGTPGLTLYCTREHKEESCS